MDLSIKTSETDGTSRVAVTGEVDVSNAAKLREAVDGALAAGAERVEVDLGEVSYIDSTGIGVLVGAAHRAEEGGVAFEVANPQRNVRRVLGLLGVERELHVGE